MSIMAENSEDAHSDNDLDSPFSQEELSSESKGIAALATGNNVNLTITGSEVNVVSGDQHTTKRSVAVEGVNCEKLIGVVNRNTRSNTTERILELFPHERLRNPTFQVFPLMRRFESEDYYYKGQYGELAKEFGFHHQNPTNNESFLKFDDLMTSVLKSDNSEKNEKPKEQMPITAIVASAGSGKTTLMQRIARNALQSAEKANNVDRRMIYYIEIKNITSKESMKPSKFLFHGLYKNEFDEANAYEWLVENQNDALLVFDGLDQACWKIDEDNLQKINPYEEASPPTIMYNILSRRILRDLKIVISSREFRVSELPPMARPPIIITLAGLTEHDAEKLFKNLIGDNAEEHWEKIRVMSPRLLHLVSIPVFLILTAIVMGKDLTIPPPTTVTELYNRILSSLQSVEIIKEKKQILSIISKLKEMAFRGMIAGRVLFHEGDLVNFKLKTDEIQDLMMKVPYNDSLRYHLMEGNFTFCFCHQSIQEFLAASYVAEMDFNEFRSFNEKDIHEIRWSVVRRFVAGIIFSKLFSKIHKVSEKTKKQQVLEQSIRSQLKKTEGGEDKLIRMELYTAIFESGNIDLMEMHSVIDAAEIKLSRDEAHIIGSLAARNKDIESFNLKSCCMDDKLCGIIERCLYDRIHVKKLNLLGNNVSATALRSLLAHDQIESLTGNVGWKVVRMNVANGDFKIKIKGKLAKIRNENKALVGQLNLEESLLEFAKVHLSPVVVFYGTLFEPTLIKVTEQHLYATQDDLRALSKLTSVKISRMLIDCTEKEDVNWAFVQASIGNYKVDLLDIAVRGGISADDYEVISTFGNGTPGFVGRVNFHEMFYAQNADDFENIRAACQQKELPQIEYIRCKLGDATSPENIMSLVKNCKSKRLTLVYEFEDQMLKGEMLEKARKNCNDMGTELEVLCVLRSEADAWRKLDQDWHSKKTSNVTDTPSGVTGNEDRGSLRGENEKLELNNSNLNNDAKPKNNSETCCSDDVGKLDEEKIPAVHSGSAGAPQSTSIPTSASTPGKRNNERPLKRKKSSDAYATVMKDLLNFLKDKEKADADHLFMASMAEELKRIPDIRLRNKLKKDIFDLITNPTAPDDVLP